MSFSKFLTTALFYVGSQSAEDLTMNAVNHKRSKYLFVKNDWIREHVDPDGLVSDIFRETVTGSILKT